MKKQKQKKKKVNILKVTAFITQILAIITMAKTKSKLIYTLDLCYVIWSYFYIVAYKKEAKKDGKK